MTVLLNSCLICRPISLDIWYKLQNKTTRKAVSTHVLNARATLLREKKNKVMIINNVKYFLFYKLKTAKEKNCVTARQEDRQNVPLVPSCQCPLHRQRFKNTTRLF